MSWTEILGHFNWMIFFTLNLNDHYQFPSNSFTDLFCIPHNRYCHTAGLYGVYEDLFDGAYFTPNVNLTIEFDYNEELVTPVFR